MVSFRYAQRSAASIVVSMRHVALFERAVLRAASLLNVMEDLGDVEGAEFGRGHLSTVQHSHRIAVDRLLRLLHEATRAESNLV